MDGRILPDASSGEFVTRQFHLQTVESILTPSSAPVLFVTGTPEVVVQAGQLDEAVALAKPFPVDTLCQVLIGPQTIRPSVADRRGKGG